MLSQIIYSTVRIYVRTVLRFFYRKWQIHGTENIPTDGAVIYVVNHQNAFLDAILIACATKDEPWFLTRAGVFANSLASKVLSIFHMMPVYRFRDGYKSLRNNDATFRQCLDILNSKGSILLFVEGDQSMQWQLRALQKGFARIALAYLQENEWKQPLYLLPVGIQYDHYYNFRSRVLLNYGSAIPIDSTFQNLTEREFLDSLVNLVKTNLKPLMLHIENEHYKEIETYVKNHRSENDLLKQLSHNQSIADTWNDQSQNKKYHHKTNHFMIALASPLLLYAIINNILPYGITRWFLKKYVNEEFKGSLKLAFGMIVVPLFYLLQTGIVQLIFHDWRITLAYAFTLPFISVWSVDLYKRATNTNQ